MMINVSAITPMGPAALLAARLIPSFDTVLAGCLLL